MNNTSPKIAVAMSGGMDSSAVAWMLKQKNYNVIGITMRLFPNPNPNETEKHILDAKRVCDKLGIEHVVADFSEEFEKRIILPFVTAYMLGETPSPCMLCNPVLKFGALFDIAKQYGCQQIATGHYIITDKDENGTAFIRRGKDPRKDQSYFLAQVSQEQLKTALFPLGESKKADIKELGISLGLIPKDKGESQDLCFIPDGDYVKFILNRHPELKKPGNIVDSTGKVMGKHDGFFAYTIGQRRGIGLSGGPWFVIQIIPETNEIVIGREDELARKDFLVHSTNWQSIPDPKEGDILDVELQIRYAMSPIPAKLIILANKEVKIEVSKELRGITPGQGAVFYKGDRLLGGGWISK